MKSICHQWFNLNFMKRREYFLYANKIKRMTLFQQIISSLSLLVSVAPFWILPFERKQHTLFCIRLNARMRMLHVFTLWFEWIRNFWVKTGSAHLFPSVFCSAYICKGHLQSFSQNQTWHSSIDFNKTLYFTYTVIKSACLLWYQT